MKLKKEKNDQAFGEMGKFVQRNDVLLNKRQKVCFSFTRNTCTCSRKMQKRLFTHNCHTQRFVSSFLQ